MRNRVLGDRTERLGKSLRTRDNDKRLSQLGRENAERGEMLGAKTARERAYLAAVSNLYRDFERTPQHARLLAYRNAMGDVAAKYPEYHEAKIFYALALSVARIPGTRPMQISSRRGQFSRNCSRRSRRIRGWHTILSMRTTCRRSLGNRSLRRAGIQRLLPMRPMRCICHRIHLPAWDIGRRRLIAMWPLRRRHGGRVRRQKSYMPATTRPTHTCKRGRIRRPTNSRIGAGNCITLRSKGVADRRGAARSWIFRARGDPCTICIGATGLAAGGTTGTEGDTVSIYRCDNVVCPRARRSATRTHRGGETRQPRRSS